MQTVSPDAKWMVSTVLYASGGTTLKPINGSGRTQNWTDYAWKAMSTGAPWSPDSHFIVLQDLDSLINSDGKSTNLLLVDTHGSNDKKLKLSGEVDHIAISPDSRTVCANIWRYSGPSDVAFWDVSAPSGNGQCHTVRLGSYVPESLAWLDSNHVLVAASPVGKPGTEQLFAIDKTNRRVSVLPRILSGKWVKFAPYADAEGKLVARYDTQGRDVLAVLSEQGRHATQVSTIHVDPGPRPVRWNLLAYSPIRGWLWRVKVAGEAELRHYDVTTRRIGPILHVPGVTPYPTADAQGRIWGIQNGKPTVLVKP